MRLARRCTTLFLVALLWAIGSGCSAVAEVGRDNTYELLRQRQLELEQQRIEQELTNPRVVTVAPDRAVRGPAKAPVAIYVFSDFQCPYCAKGAQTVAAVEKKYGKKVKVTFLHFPMPMHAQARPAAQYFEAIALQSPAKAYQFHDLVFKTQDKLTSERETFLDATAKAVGANLERLKKDIAGETVKARIAGDEKMAQEFGFTGTPGFIVSGVVLKGAYPQETFDQIIDYRLKPAARKTASEKSAKKR